ncbi:hypothetical protein Dda_4291 [Drechslerella dactyloides]|uniref:Uncharacterized protein n=1 Tax=Drechslerella dactyloides TaxID=74499 RepID=A0AAD6IZY0_DREDA|nr:hypothetical protein Dda_4291 [Drechslerella dactyloides]
MVRSRDGLISAVYMGELGNGRDRQTGRVGTSEAGGLGNGDDEGGQTGRRFVCDTFVEKRKRSWRRRSAAAVGTRGGIKEGAQTTIKRNLEDKTKNPFRDNKHAASSKTKTLKRRARRPRFFAVFSDFLQFLRGRVGAVDNGSCDVFAGVR